mmetsp:Transcript_4961/g.9487  ORF Transcript_4961/g.9487 Transcript_4961/m.9487 type:complete len:372 (-) Transcript_4961:154-1269(-)
MVLATISEQRRVSFASRRVPSYADSYQHSHPCIDIDIDAVAVAVETRLVPSLSNYSIGDKRGIWYSGEEIGAMRQNAFRDIHLRKEELKYIGKKRCLSLTGIGASNTNDNGNDNANYYASDIRGLERLVYDGDNHDCLRKRYECLRAVLQEQHNQRTTSKSRSTSTSQPCSSTSTNTNIDIDTDTNKNRTNTAEFTANFEPAFDLDDERIRRVCMEKGDTRKSQQKAHQLAREDEAGVREYLQQEQVQQEQKQQRERQRRQQQERQRRHQQQQAAFPCNYYGEQQHQHAHANAAMLSPVVGRNSHRNRARIEMAMPSSRGNRNDHDCCWCVKVVDVVGRSLLFHSLLKPFLTLHNHPVDAFTFLEPAHRPQ